MMAELFETFPTTAAGAAALFERLAEQLYTMTANERRYLGDDHSFTVLEHQLEWWGTDAGIVEANQWAAGMAAALKRIAAVAAA